MALDSIEKIKKDIKGRIEVNYIRNFDFYHGYLIACFMADIIKSGKEYKELVDWVKTLDINGGKENGK